MNEMNEKQNIAEDPVIERPFVPFKLHAHKTKGDAYGDILDILVADPPGPGGAHHCYVIAWATSQPSGDMVKVCGHGEKVRFQCGPIKEVGVNGVTNEALLAIVAHRLDCFQYGPYACEDNGEALLNVRTALENLKARTQRRIDAGTEGTMQK